jgi:D-alanyl-D-alanine dipeptidase
MESVGFEVYQFEWWHFDYKDWKKYPILEWWHFDYKDWKKYPILNLKFADLAPSTHNPQ